MVTYLCGTPVIHNDFYACHPFFTRRLGARDVDAPSAERAQLRPATNIIYCPVFQHVRQGKGAREGVVGTMCGLLKKLSDT